MRAGHYELADKIGQGGMGTVWRGRSPQGALVAVKLIPRWSSEEARLRFDRERRLLGALGTSEGFVPLLDAGDGATGPFIVMPLLEGGTLRDRIDKGPLPIDATVRLGHALASALGRAHAHGIVHRDLKPENVLYDAPAPGGRPLVADLGLGKHFRTDTPGASQSVALSQAGAFRGTRGYMAPEQAGAAETAGPPADVFSIGVILYECLTGVQPFDAQTAIGAVARVMTRGQTPLEQLRADTPGWLAHAIDRAIDPEPGTRFANGAELAKALEAGMSGELSSAPRRRRSRALLLAIGVLGVGLVVAVTALLLRPRTEPRSSASPSPSPKSTASPKSAPSPAPSPTGPPEWFRALPESERPPVPLPQGLVFGAKPGEYVNAKDGSVLLFVPAGTFTMGTADSTDNEPLHEVELSAYFVGKLEVSVRQFAGFVKETRHVTESERRGQGLVTDKEYMEFDWVTGACWRTPGRDGKPAPPDMPASLLSWNDAVAYVEWAGLSLPSEAEWERAAGWDAKAKKARRYSWGDDEPTRGSPRVANLADERLRPWRPLAMTIFEGYDDGYAGASPVGSFPAGTSPVGALDMTGNLCELCLDTYAADYAARAPHKDPVNLEPGLLICQRGGNFADGPSIFLVSRRGSFTRQDSHDRIGFRVVRTLVPRGS